MRVLAFALLILTLPDPARAGSLAQSIYEDLRGRKCADASASEVSAIESAALFCGPYNGTLELQAKSLDAQVDHSTFEAMSTLESANLDCVDRQLDAILSHPPLQKRLVDNTCARLPALADAANNIEFTQSWIKSFETVNDAKLRIVPEADRKRNEANLAVLRDRLKYYSGLKAAAEIDDPLLSDPEVQKVLSYKIAGVENTKPVCEQLRQVLPQLLKKSRMRIRKALEVNVKARAKPEFDDAYKRMLWASSSKDAFLKRLAETNVDALPGLMCRMEGRYGEGAEVLDRLAFMGSIAVGFGLGATSRLAAILYAQKARVGYNVARTAYVAEIALAAGLNARAIHTECVADKATVTAAPLTCKNSSDAEILNIAYAKAGESNCIFQAAMTTFAGGNAVLGLGRLLKGQAPDTLLRMLMDSNSQTKRMFEKMGQ